MYSHRGRAIGHLVALILTSVSLVFLSRSVARSLTCPTLFLTVGAEAAQASSGLSSVLWCLRHGWLPPSCRSLRNARMSSYRTMLSPTGRLLSHLTYYGASFSHSLVAQMGL